MSSVKKLLMLLGKRLRWVLVAFIGILFLAFAGENPTLAGDNDRSDPNLTAQTAPPENEIQTYVPIILRDGCGIDSFGTMLLDEGTASEKTPADVMIYANKWLGIKGMVAAGAPSEQVRDEWFSKLPGWTRAFIRGTFEQLATIHASAQIFAMEDMYECIAYGPESAHQAGSEALDPLHWVPLAKILADNTGKCLIYGPAVQDYETMAMIEGESEPDEILLGDLISSVSPHVDIWMIQAAKYQRWADAGFDDSGSPFTMADFAQWANWWVIQIENGNPQAQVWVQVGIGVFDPLSNQCLPPQPPEYILQYWNTLLNQGVDGVFVMPSQPCQLSTDPEDHQNYLNALGVFQEALDLACTETEE